MIRERALGFVGFLTLGWWLAASSAVAFPRAPAKCEPCAQDPGNESSATLTSATLTSTASATSAASDEGALENDSEIPTNAAALAQLHVGDLMLSKLREPARDLAGCTPVFEAWRAALVASRAEDLVIEDGARFALSVETSVTNRVLAISTTATQAFSARFSALAENELAAAGSDANALARVEHEFPFTRAAVIAALREADIAFERGDTAFAHSAVERAAVDAALAKVTGVDEAIRARRTFFAVREDTSKERSAFDACTGLRALHEVALSEDDTTDATKRHLEPSLAFDTAKNAWIQAGERLHRVDAKFRVTSLTPATLLASRGLGFLPAFGEKTYDWIQRPAIFGSTLALVCGRTHETRDNALLALDIRAGDAARAQLAWAYTDAGFVGADGQTTAVADVLLPGRLEFQPGPVFAGGRLCVAVRQWFAKDGGVRQAVDEARTVVWLVAFDVRTGLPDWKREIARGSDLRGRGRDRFTEARGLSQPAAPLVFNGVSNMIFVDTELGVASEVDAADGRATWSVRCARTNDAVARRPSGRIAAQTTGAGWVWVPADAGGVLYSLTSDKIALDAAQIVGPSTRATLLSPPPRRLAGLAALVGLSGSSVIGLEESGGRTQLVAVDPATLARRAALAFGRNEEVHGLYSTTQRVLCASGGTLTLIDTQRDLYRLNVLRIDGLPEETALSLHQDGSRVYVVGPKKLWVFAIE